MEIYVTFLSFPYFLIFLVFSHDFIIYIDFTHIAASNTASDGVTDYNTHRIFNTDLLYSCSHLILEIDEKI